MTAILLLTKRTPSCDRAVTITRALFPPPHTIEHHAGNSGDPYPVRPRSEYTYIISYLSPWIVRQPTLDMAEQLAINFHPAPPEYPGSGGYNLAILDSAETYGVTCHHMHAAVDTGPIIRQVRFKTLGALETVSSLKARAMATLEQLYAEIMLMLSHGETLPRSMAEWSGPANRWQDIDKLRRITRDMHPVEIRRRARAFHFPGTPGIHIDAAGLRFDLTDYGGTQ